MYNKNTKREKKNRKEVKKMKKVDLRPFANTDSKNNGIAREWAVCRYFGIKRTKHDSKDYKSSSDVELINGRNISVKSPGFSLMNGTLCRGCNTFEGIWRRYYKNCHSNEWAFVTKDWQCYFMDKKEFSKLIHKFGYIAHESSSKGGDMKIRTRDNKKLIAWLESQVA